MRILRLSLFVAALAVVGHGSLWAESAPSYTLKQLIIVKQAGKPDRHCEVTAVTPQADGSFVYQMKVKETGELLTIHDRVSAPPPGPTPAALPAPPALPAPMATPKVPAVLTSDSPNNAAKEPAKKDAKEAVNKPRPSDRMTARIPVELPAMPWENSGLSLFAPKSTSGTPTLPPTTTTPIPPSDTPSGNAVARRWSNLLSPSPKPTMVSPSRLPVPSSPASIPAVPRLDELPPIVPPPVVQTDRPTQLPDSATPSPLPPIVINSAPKGLMIPVPERQASESRFAREERIVQLGAALRDSLLPSHREAAADQLAEGDGATSATVRSMLMTAAANDPAGTVRANCLRHLSKMDIRDAAYEALLTAAKQDSHPRVREELMEALEKLRR